MAINLLPEKEKKELQIEEIARKLSLVFLFLFIFLLVLIFILFSLKIYILSQVKIAQDILQSKEEFLISSRFQNFKKIIEKTNLNLSKIRDFYDKQIFLTPILEKVSNLTPQTIYFTNLSFLTEIRISGYASTRENLFFFKQALEAEEQFEDVYFSPASWTTPTDINFSLSFKFKK